ncbi:hypothetical protein LZP73_06220 [Shewanella sp. AS16]|uniref:hypothetical protein n=1 Tax=Shewanella sp. AS16 TaxID=2907625 RepID=UPI001F39DBE1|nr:hypothetical protein [Shewanella sp. AS16]MCE9685812.1 hypothetical protein [Shewanella sp. AS16]
MNIYRLKPIENSVEVADFSLLEFAEVLGDNDLSLVRSQPRTNASLAANWRPTSCNLAPAYKKGHAIPDVSYWGSYLLMSSSAYELFRAQLEHDGEFLPINVEGNNMFIFIPLTFGKEDFSRTVKHYEDGYECGLELLTFDNASVANKLIFKSQLYGTHALFATEQFKLAFERAGLAGIEFDTDLANIF